MEWTASEGRLDDRVLEELYRRVFGYQFRLAGGNRPAAEELAQETMVRILRSREDLRDPGRLIPWALRIATHVRIDALRRRPAAELGREVEDPRGTAEPRSREETSAVLSQLAALPESYRAPITLRYFEDLGYEEMSAILDLPVGTVKSNVARGLRLIRRRMEETNDGLR